MVPQIEVSDEVFRELQARAEPLVDSPDAVLRRVLGLDETSEAQVLVPARATLPRATQGEILPESEYELPILRYLEANGGRAPSREVVKAVGELADRLTELDRAPLKAGDIRWQARTAFVRLRLVERGEARQGLAARDVGA